MSCRIVDPFAEAMPPGVVSHGFQGYSAVERKGAGATVGIGDRMRPRSIFVAQVQSILKNLPEEALASNPDLTIDARHPAGGPVRRVDERIVQAEPCVEGIGAVEGAEIVEIQAG